MPSATKTRRTTQATKPAVTYAWRENVRIPIKAEVAGAALDYLRTGNKGILTPSLVVDAARHPDHPLHKAFTWDDSAAAEKYRENQARVLISSVRVVVIGPDDKATSRVAFLSVINREEGRGYMTSAAVMGDSDYRNQALEDALISLQGWKRRYNHLEELAKVFEAIDAIPTSRKRK